MNCIVVCGVLLCVIGLSSSYPYQKPSKKQFEPLDPETSIRFLQGILADINDAELASGSAEIKRRLVSAHPVMDLGTNRGYSGFRLGSIGSALHDAYSSLGPGRK